MCEADPCGASWGIFVRIALIFAGALSSILAAAPAAAATVVVYANPETMERRVVVLTTEGPDRMYLCMLPPGEAGCHRVDIKR